MNFVNQRYPLPNDLTVGNGVNTGGFRFNAPSHRADNTYTGRVDLNITNVQRLFVRANKISAAQTDTVNSVAAQFPGDPETAQIITGDWAFAVGHNWTADSEFCELSNSRYHEIRSGISQIFSIRRCPSRTRSRHCRRPLPASPLKLAKFQSGPIAMT